MLLCNSLYGFYLSTHLFTKYSRCLPVGLWCTQKAFQWPNVVNGLPHEFSKLYI